MKPSSILEGYTIINLRIAEFFLVGQGEIIGQWCVIYTYSIPYLTRFMFNESIVRFIVIVSNLPILSKITCEWD